MSGPEDPARRFFRRRWEAGQLPVSGVWAARRRLADAMRRVIEHLTTSDAPQAELETAAVRLEDYAAHLGTHPRRERTAGREHRHAEQTERVDGHCFRPARSFINSR